MTFCGEPLRDLSDTALREVDAFAEDDLITASKLLDEPINVLGFGWKSRWGQWNFAQDAMVAISSEWKRRAKKRRVALLLDI